jgi:hypothetical protein
MQPTKSDSTTTRVEQVGQPGGASRNLHSTRAGRFDSNAAAREPRPVLGERGSPSLLDSIARLRTLVSRAAYDLKAAGAETKARRLLRALESG